MQKSRIIFFVFVLFYQMASYAQSLCWKISKPGTKQVSYVYGTMHSDDARIFKLSAAVEKAIDSCAVFVNEMDMENLDVLSIMQEMISPKNSLQESISALDYARLDSICQIRLHLPAAFLDHIQPILVTSVISTPSAEEKDSSKNVLDVFLAEKCKKKGMQIKGLETAAEQIQALNALKYEDQIEFLVQTLHEEKKPENDFEKLIGFYIQGNLDSLLSMSDEAKFPEKFKEELITKRNKRMADRMEKMASDKAHFFTVGALHLPGEKGVLSLLRKKGFSVTAVF